jgi:5-formyltetrahydrofolate cyclo-ligase
VSLAEIKAAARAAGFARRKLAFECAPMTQAGYLSEVLAGYRGVPVSGYMPMRTEIDPLPAMAEAAAHGPVGVPVIMAKGEPLQFALWEPDCAMVEGPFKAQVPAVLHWMIPQILIVPLVAFDRRGGRLGYGGGFYDRTLQGLRATGPVMAIGFAFAGQQDDGLPLEATDQPLDLIVTEAGIITL